MDTPSPAPSENPRPDKEEKPDTKKRKPANSLSMDAERMREVMKKLGIEKPDEGQP